jgi:hypothetical protein
VESDSSTGLPGGLGITSSCSVVGCLFGGLTNPGNGGALSSTASGVLVLVGWRAFKGCSGNYGGGIYLRSGDSCAIKGVCGTACAASSASGSLSCQAVPEGCSHFSLSTASICGRSGAVNHLIRLEEGRSASDSVNSTKNFADGGAGFYLCKGVTQTIPFFQCANNTLKYFLFINELNDAVSSASNIVYNTVTDSQCGLLYCGSASLALLNSVAKWNSDASNRISSEVEGTFTVRGCGVQPHASVDESGSISMAELLLSLYSSQECHADLPFKATERAGCLPQCSPLPPSNFLPSKCFFDSIPPIHCPSLCSCHLLSPPLGTQFAAIIIERVEKETILFLPFLIDFILQKVEINFINFKMDFFLTKIGSYRPFR